MVDSIIIATNFMKVRIHTLIMLINCDFSGEKLRALMLTPYENTFYFALFIAFNNFSVMDTDSLVALALETCATIPP